MPPFMTPEDRLFADALGAFQPATAVAFSDTQATMALTAKQTYLLTPLGAGCLVWMYATGGAHSGDGTYRPEDSDIEITPPVAMTLRVLRAGSVNGTLHVTPMKGRS